MLDALSFNRSTHRKFSPSTPAGLCTWGWWVFPWWHFPLSRPTFNVNSSRKLSLCFSLSWCLFIYYTQKLMFFSHMFLLIRFLIFPLDRSYSDIMGISFVRIKSKFLSLSHKALYQLTFAHSTTFFLPVSLYTLHLGGISLLSLLEHILYSGSSHMLSPLFGTSFPQPPCLAIS